MLRAFLIILIVGCAPRAYAQKTPNTSHLKKPVSTSTMLKINSFTLRTMLPKKANLTFKTKQQLKEIQKIIQLLKRISKMWHEELPKSSGLF